MSEFKAFLNEERQKVNKYIHQYFEELIDLESESYLRRYFKFLQEFLLQGGRRIHPISLVQTFFGLASETEIIEYYEEIYQVSIAAELMHIASLVLDDLIDQEELRQGKSTFHKRLHEFSTKYLKSDSKEKFINASTIYGSNLIAMLGVNIINKSPFGEKRKNRAIQALYEGLQGITRGRLLNEYYRMIPLDRVRLEDYIILAGLKRGKQMETAVNLGALLGNARYSQCEPLSQVMNKIGIIEQLINDYKGSFGDPRQDPIDSDIKSGQLTILTVVAYQSANEQQKKILNATLGNNNATEDEIEKVREIFIETGAVDFIKYYSNSLRNDIYNILKTQVYPGLREKAFNYFSEDIIDYIIEIEI